MTELHTDPPSPLSLVRSRPGFLLTLALLLRTWTRLAFRVCIQPATTGPQMMPTFLIGTARGCLDVVLHSKLANT